MNPTDICLICGKTAEALAQSPLDASLKCPVCGPYRIGVRLLAVLIRTRRNGEPVDALVPYLSCHTRQSSPEIAHVEVGNWEALATKHKESSDTEKTRKLLAYMRERSRFPGQLIDISDDDYPVFDTGSIEEKDALIRQAIADGYVSGNHPLYALTRGGKDFLTERPGERRVFLSHATDDAGIAEVLANAIRERLAGTGVEVFVSSQSGNIPTGKKWLDVVETKLITGTTYLVLITPRSVFRPWLWFETGSFWFKGRQMIVLCADGYAKGEVPYPLGSIQMLSLDEREDIVTLFEKDLHTTTPDVDALIAAFKARSMGGLAHVRTEPPPKENPSGTKWGCYQFKDEGEKLYCTACWDSKGMKSLTNRMNSRQRSCPVCKAVIGSG